MTDIHSPTRGHLFDVCAGDADGLCATLQWRMQHPENTQLLAGLHDDTALLQNLQARPGDALMVCSLPFDANRGPVQRLLQKGATVRYLDHRDADPLPTHPRLHATKDASQYPCTSLLVDRLIGGAARGWALVGAYGSNLRGLADRMAQSMGWLREACERLRKLGELISYNARATTPRDAYISPASLYAQMARYADPLELLEHENLAGELAALRCDDLQQALAWAPYWQDAKASVLVLPDTPWGHRASGCLGGELARLDPERAHAVLRPHGDGFLEVRVQAANRDEAGLGTRARRWMIERLPVAELDFFIRAFSASGWGELRSPVFRAWS